MRVLLPLLGWFAACHGNEPHEQTPKACAGSNHSQVSTTTATGVTLAGCGGLTFDEFSVLGDGTFTIDLFSDGEQVIPHVVSEADGGVFRGLDMAGTFELDGETPLRWWPQSDGDGARGIEDLPDALALDTESVPALDGPGTAPWAGLVGRDGGASALVGAHSALLSRFTVAVAADGAVHAVWGDHGEALPLDSGQELYLDPLFVWVGLDALEGWTTWGQAVALAAGASSTRPPPPGRGFTIEPTKGENESTLAATIDHVDAWKAEPGPPYVAVLEQGWQEANGTWTASPVFPSGSGAVPPRLIAAGLVPGLWMAPLAADPASEVAAQHPDWWVEDEAGAPLVVDGLLALDVTQPEAAGWLLGVMQAKGDEGWQVFVLDHLALGAVEGVRNVPVTGTIAYRRGLELVRSVLPDAWITAVDAPLLPSVGLVDGLRGGPESVLRAGLSGVVWTADLGAVSLDTDVSMSAPFVAGMVTGATVAVEGPLPAPPDDDAVEVWTRDLGVAAPVAPLATTGTPFCWTFDDGCGAGLNTSDADVTGSCSGATDVTLPADSGDLWGCGGSTGADVGQ